MDIPRSDENTLWVGKPLLRPYLINTLIKEGAGWRLFAVFIGITFLFSLMNESSYNWSLLLVFSLLMIGVFSYQTVSRSIRIRRTRYIITTEKVIIENGTAESPFYIDKSKIKLVDIGSSRIYDKYKVGTVFIHTDEIILVDGKECRKIYEIESIRNPELVIRLL